MAGEQSYWQRTHVGRRSVLGAAGAGLSALALAACGGSNNKSNGASAISGNTNTGGGKGLLPAAATATPAAATKQPKPGGSFSWQMPTAPPSLDPYTQTSYLNSYVNGLTYSKLYRFKAGVPAVAPTDISQEPDLAAAMPEIADPMTYVVKLKKAKWQNVAPVNGRDLTSEDVKYAIDRYHTFDKSVHKSTWSFLDHVETPDPQTVVFKTKYPYADFVNIAGGNLGAYISPKEHAETDAAATKMVGSGPFIHTEYQTGVSFTWKKNPDYYDAPYPYFDEIKAFVTTDQAKRVADFSAKSADLSWLFLPDDRDQVKKQRPDAKSDEQQGISAYIYVRADKPPFNDKRVRQALSMAIDRGAIRSALTKGEGVNDQAVFVGIVGIARQVKDLGANAKNWDYNPQAAKQLLQAAGQENLSFQWSHADASVYTQAYVDTATLTQAQWKQVGVTVQDNQQPYAQYVSTTYQGNYEGAAHSPRAVPYFLDALYEQAYTASDGSRGRINVSHINDPALNQLLDKQRTQFDLNERKQTIAQIEDVFADQQYQIYYSTDTRTYFWSPDIQNYRPTAFFPYTHLMKSWRDR